MNLHRVAIAALILGFASGVVAQPTRAQQPQIKLFKVITTKDEVTIGLTDAELRGLGTAADIDNLAQTLVRSGEMSVWQYAVKHGSDGTLVQAPLRRVAIFKSDTLRNEPYNPAPLAVVAPQGDGKP